MGWFLPFHHAPMLRLVVQEEAGLQCHTDKQEHRLNALISQLKIYFGNFKGALQKIREQLTAQGLRTACRADLTDLTMDTNDIGDLQRAVLALQ